MIGYSFIYFYVVLDAKLLDCPWPLPHYCNDFVPYYPPTLRHFTFVVAKGWCKNEFVGGVINLAQIPQHATQMLA